MKAGQHITALPRVAGLSLRGRLAKPCHDPVHNCGQGFKSINVTACLSSLRVAGRTWARAGGYPSASFFTNPDNLAHRSFSRVTCSLRRWMNSDTGALACVQNVFAVAQK